MLLNKRTHYNVALNREKLACLAEQNNITVVVSKKLENYAQGSKKLKQLFVGLFTRVKVAYILISGELNM